MRKQLITAFLLLIWLCQLSGRYLITFEFYLNQAYIAKNLCINRNNPDMHCNGHCQMKKQLAAEDKKEQQNPERRIENKSEYFVAGMAITAIQPICTTVSNEQHTPQTIGYPVDLSRNIFHPPGA